MLLQSTRVLTLSLIVSAFWMRAGESASPDGAVCSYHFAAHPEGDVGEGGDSRIEALARRYAPVVKLDGRDWTRPASVEWLLEAGGAGATAEATPPKGLRLQELPLSVRKGSDDPQDWKTYVHVHSVGEGGGLQLQYWFFYPYNDGPWFFDHEGDWEHVTVVLDGQDTPVGVYAARHENNAPGVFRAWAQVRRVDGDHPEILSAKGTHASYFDEADVSWRDRVSDCGGPEADCEAITWRTWEGGGLVHVGEAHVSEQAFMMKYRDPWGSAGFVPGTSAPLGPAFQRGWCAQLNQIHNRGNDR